MFLVETALVCYRRNQFSREMATLVLTCRAIRLFVQRIQKLFFGEVRFRNSRPITKFQRGAKIILSLGARVEEWTTGWKGRAATTKQLCNSASSLFGPLRWVNERLKEYFEYHGLQFSATWLDYILRGMHLLVVGPEKDHSRNVEIVASDSTSTPWLIIRYFAENGMDFRDRFKKDNVG